MRAVHAGPIQTLFGADQSSWALAAALMGGTLAATSHLAKATTRAAVNTSPKPFSNVGMSLLGDALVPTALWLSWTHPAMFAVLLLVTVVAMVGLIWVLGHFLRQLATRVTAWGRPSVQRS